MLALPSHRPLFVAALLAVAGCGLGLTGSCASGPDKRQVALKEAEFHYGLAGGFYSEGDVGQALGELITALERDPDYAEAHYLMAVVRVARREFYEALRHAERSVALRPDFYDAQNLLGATYLALCRWDDAVRLFEKLVGEPRYSTPEFAHNNLGWALWNLNRRAEAFRQFKKAVFFSPKLCVAFNNLGLFYLEEGRYEDAEKQLHRALSADPICEKTYAEPHLHLARMYERQSRVADACHQLQICVERAPPGEEQASSGCGHSPVGERCERKAAQLNCPSAPAAPPAPPQ